jgi:carbonic anhydrase
MMNRILSPYVLALALALCLLPTRSVMASDPAPTANISDKLTDKAADKAKVTVSPAPSSDDEMSKALTNKISKGSGDIVIRTSDLPVGGSAPVSKEPKSKPAVKALAKTAEKEVHTHHWSYFDGPEGPENWGNLSKDNLACLKGKSQSPININVDRAVKVQLDPIEFIYRPSPLSIIDNGYTVMVNYGEGSNLMVDGRQYR